MKSYYKMWIIISVIDITREDEELIKKNLLKVITELYQ